MCSYNGVIWCMHINVKHLTSLFQNIILFCDAKKDENIRKFSQDLNTLIYKIRNKLMDLKNQVLLSSLIVSIHLFFYQQ